MASRSDTAVGRDGGGTESDHDLEGGAAVVHREGGAARHFDVEGHVKIVPEVE